MTTYHVSWEIEVDAKSPAEAAFEAAKMLRDPQGTATIFDVITRSALLDCSGATPLSIDVADYLATTRSI